MLQTVKPVDNEHQAQDRYHQRQQIESLFEYTAAFKAKSLECSNTSNAKTLERYIASLKPTTQDSYT